MKISKINIKNFRLLKEVSLSLEKETTVIVGRNNSGKTSLAEFIHRLLSDKPIFRIEDFSLPVYDDFWKAFTIKSNGGSEKEIREALPVIQGTLTLNYAGDTAFGPLGDFIIDLNSDCSTAIVAISYRLDDGNISPFFEDLVFDETKKSDFFQAMKERVPRFYKANLSAVDPNDSTNVKLLEWSKLQRLLDCGFVNAQRGLDDETYKDKDVLGRILEVLFTTAMSETANQYDRDAADKLEDAVKAMQGDIDEGFNENLKKLLPALSLFGYPGLIDPGILTETTLDVRRLLKDHTKIRYAGANGISLPEAFNGLGARNLIFILLKLLEFFKTYKAKEGAPGVHLVFIEEPEAHLHPQMQEVFIRQLGAIAKVFADKYNNGAPWPVQFVVSTHSSHIANEASFESMRYFISVPENQFNGFICSTKIKDLSRGLSDTASDVKDFLHQYMTLTSCDLLFADKAILIEGTTERLLLPRIIEKVDASQTTADTPKLASQYISVLEVGGAYAHKFFDLLSFLELRTLIITDLDTVKKEGTKYIACKVSVGTRTSNGCIKDWFRVPDIAPTDLIQKSATEKTHDICRLSYQVPETLNGLCGRSFEDAFMLANLPLFSMDSVDQTDLEQKIWDEADTKRNKKIEFALDYAIDKKDWNVPRYIAEGLIWLANNPEELVSQTANASQPTIQND